jgi:hypothetical protein
MKLPKCLSLVAVVALLSSAAISAEPLESAATIEIRADVLADKIRGGLLGQLLGNLNGLAHEMKYINEPGNVEVYTPALPEGARTDDDTDLEWVYIVAMERRGELFLPPDEIVRLWKTHISQNIWCANDYARKLMDLGIDPPLSGHSAVNPWSEFNLSGQFICETFALASPAMPQSAARLGLHYTHVAIDGEPAQTTQLFTTMIATAFITGRIEAILDAGLAAIDPRSKIREIMADVRRWNREHPDDWRTTRRLVRDKYSRYGGELRDRNGFELNTAGTVAALLYGKGNFTETLRMAFNFGWDADNNAATAGTIIGVIRGHRWMQDQGWDIEDRYRNTTRPGMPDDETITRFGDRLVRLAERHILERGGRKTTRDGTTVYQVSAERPAMIEPLSDPTEERDRLRASLSPKIERDLLEGQADSDRGRAAYLAVCLELAEGLSRAHPAEWRDCIAALRRQATMLGALKNSPCPAAVPLRQRMTAAGAP